MDWYSWFSKTNLDKSLVYDYALLFSRNELEEDDILHFNHEFLQSMGISIAKHRLEILKLSKRYKPFRQSQPAMTRLITALYHTKQCLVRCIKALVHREHSSAIVVVPRPPPKKSEMLKRRRKSEGTHKVMHERPTKMIMAGPGLSSRGTSPLVLFEDRFGSGLGSVESIRWDSMFQGFASLAAIPAKIIGVLISSLKIIAFLARQMICKAAKRKEKSLEQPPTSREDLKVEITSKTEEAAEGSCRPVKLRNWCQNALVTQACEEEMKMSLITSITKRTCCLIENSQAV
ncbi:hypothetical protein LUZ61_008388 [Rhynchospora tenuis]|uniref:SAM domain-containing protein n=1 Tax=Rhynchospora tenuis TaxID=198213 RepID=A0AAD6EXE3_9POAL|nr:hypothetical protein LUZ61_008388 [Rhynchospora tenuis]